MKRTISTLMFAAASAYIPPAFSQYSFYPFPHYAPENAVYITAGGGVAGILNSNFYRDPLPPPYLEIRQPSSSDTVVGTVNGAVGYQFSTIPIRAEVAYRWYDTATYKWDILYEGYDNHDGNATIDSQTVLFNLYFDWYNTTRLTPFIGAGIGYYNNESTFDHSFVDTGIDLPPAHNTNEGLAWTAILGVKYEITEAWLIDIRAEYTDLGSVYIYTDTGPDGSNPGKNPFMKTNELSAISGLLNITYAYNL